MPRNEFEFAKLLLKYLTDDDLSSLKMLIMTEQYKRSEDFDGDVNDYLGDGNGRD